MSLSAQELRERAASCERRAAETIDQNAKVHFLDLAKSWRQLADQKDLPARAGACVP